MTWIVITILFAIVGLLGIAAMIVGMGMKPKEGYSDPNPALWKGGGAAALLGSVLLWLMVTAGMSYHNIAQREVGLTKSFTGTIGDKILTPGAAWTAPWNGVLKEKTGILHDEWTFDSDNAAVSIDQQKVTALIGINYQLDVTTDPKTGNPKVVDLYRTVGPSWKKIIIDARVPQDFKEVTATFTTPDLTKRREDLRTAFRNRLEEELQPYDIKVVDVFIRNIGFSASYTEAIEKKQAQVQAALTAQAKVAQIEAEARQKVAAAEGEAKANVARAQGDAKANKLRQVSLTPLLIQQMAIEKLNPNVSIIVCPPRTVCIPNTTGVLDTGGK